MSARPQSCVCPRRPPPHKGAERQPRPRGGRALGQGCRRRLGNGQQGRMWLGPQILGRKQRADLGRPLLLGPQCRWAPATLTEGTAGSATPATRKPMHQHVFHPRSVWPQFCHHLSRYFAQTGDFLYYRLKENKHTQRNKKNEGKEAGEEEGGRGEKEIARGDRYGGFGL